MIKKLEGILATNFLNLLKKKYKNYKLVKLNKFNLRNNFLYNYIVPFLGVFKIWLYFMKGFKTCYINYLPIWNIFNNFVTKKKQLSGQLLEQIQKKVFFTIH